MGARAKAAPKDRGHRREGVPEPPRLWKAGVLAFGVTWIALLVRWWPLTRYPLWGSDSGEYATLLDSYMVTGGHFPDPYLGWGGGYPDFRGMYTLAGSFSQISGLDPFLCLSIVIPSAAALSALFAFAITLRLSGSLRAATVAGAIVATAMPEVFAGSHAMPGALGGMLALAVVCAAVLATRSTQMRVVMLVLIFALVPTHHLSSYLAAVMLAVGALLEARRAPADVTRSRAVDACLLGAGALLLLSGLFWSWGAPHFRYVVLDATSPLIGRILPGMAVLAVIALVVLTWYLETLPRSLRAFRAIFDERRTAVRFAVAGLSTLAAVALLSTVGVPGTSVVVPLAAMLPFVPLGFTLAACCAGPARLAPVRGALLPFGATLGIAVSGILGLILLPTVLFPYRHLQYFVDAAAPLAAVALTFAARTAVVQLLPRRRALHRPVASALLAVLIIACASTGYPPKGTLSGFQEGTTSTELAAVVWLNSFVPTTLVASDHRLSSVVFGFAHQDATWEFSAPILLSNATVARDALETVKSPRGANGTTLVLLSKDVVEGAALSQWTPATPIQGAALDKFNETPFVRVFDNGDAVVYWVAR